MEGWVFAEDTLAELLAGAFALTVEAFEVFLGRLSFRRSDFASAFSTSGSFGHLICRNLLWGGFSVLGSFTLFVLVFLFVEGILEWLDLNPPIEFGRRFTIFLFLLIEFEVRLYCDYLNLVF